MAAAAALGTRSPASARLPTLLTRTMATAAAASSATASWVQPRTLTAPRASSLGLFPAFTPAQAAAATRVLQANHNDFHVFFNTSGFHNHTAHHVLAALGLSAPAHQYGRIWTHALTNDLDPAFKLNKKPTHGDGTQPITRSNWTAHLGKDDYYWPYLAFFEHEIAQHGVTPTLEHFLFSPDALAAPAHMLVRAYDGAVHPIIHIGQGVEFAIDGIVAEGLAMAACTENASTGLYPDGWFDRVHLENSSALAAGLSSSENTPTASSPRAGLSLFTIFARMGADPALAPGTAVQWSDGSKYDAARRTSAPRIASHLDAWLTTPADVHTDPASWEPKWAELAWINTLLLGATAPPHARAPVHDFFLMHTHNATLFVPALFRALPDLSPRARALVLHALARTTAFTWIARGRPAFFIRERLSASTERAFHPDHAPGLSSTEAVAAGVTVSIPGEQDEQEDDANDARPNAWFDLAPSASIHMDEHLVKAVRAQAYFATRLASTRAGELALQEGELPQGDEGVWRGQLGEVDGSAFVRTAGQMMEGQTWAAGLKRRMRWTQDAIGFEQAWH